MVIVIASCNKTQNSYYIGDGINLDTQKFKILKKWPCDYNDFEKTLKNILTVEKNMFKSHSIDILTEIIDARLYLPSQSSDTRNI